MRVQNFLGWLVPAYVLVLSAGGLYSDLVDRDYSHLWIPALGFAVALFLVKGLLARRRQWLESRNEAGSTEARGAL
jgi:hypothetical protein